MKTFRFPLDQALHIRRAQLEIEQAKLQRLLHQRQQLEQQGAAILMEAANTRRAIATQVLLNANEIATLPDYQRGAKHRLLKLDRMKQDLLKRTQDQSRATLEAERKVKLLEKLREKRFKEWNSEMQKEQENFAADAYLSRWTVSH
jgi:flagellar export protein FliJ